MIQKRLPDKKINSFCFKFLIFKFIESRRNAKWTSQLIEYDDAQSTSKCLAGALRAHCGAIRIEWRNTHTHTKMGITRIGPSEGMSGDRNVVGHRSRCVRVWIIAVAPYDRFAFLIPFYLFSFNSFEISLKNGFLSGQIMRQAGCIE